MNVAAALMQLSQSCFFHLCPHIDMPVGVCIVHDIYTGPSCLPTRTAQTSLCSAARSQGDRKDERWAKRVHHDSDIMITCRAKKAQLAAESAQAAAVSAKAQADAARHQAVAERSHADSAAAAAAQESRLAMAAKGQAQTSAKELEAQLKQVVITTSNVLVHRLLLGFPMPNCEGLLSMLHPQSLLQMPHTFVVTSLRHSQ